MLKKPLTYPGILRFALLASLASLAFALTAQYGFGLKPCHLCIAQRVPYGVVVALSLYGLWKKRLQVALICLIGLAFLVDSGIAGYHAAVEKQWVKGPSGCTMDDAPAQQSDDDFLKRIQNAPITTCDQPAFEWNGLTMAGMNAFWAFLLALLTFAALQQRRKKEKAHA